MAESQYEPYATREDLAQTESRLIERIARLEGYMESFRGDMQNVNARLLSLENWMRTFMVGIAMVAIGVAIQITLTLMQRPAPQKPQTTSYLGMPYETTDTFIHHCPCPRHRLPGGGAASGA